MRTPFVIPCNCLLAAALACAAVACCGAVAQHTVPVSRDSTDGLPEPIHWAQELFLIPYKWDSTSGVNSAQQVKLYLSQDRGATWNEISSGKPEVQYFTYHAPRDGEYWFCMRTIDHAGRAWPADAHRAELRVVVDTEAPEIEAFDARLAEDGQVSATWRVRDPHLDTEKTHLQYRTPADHDWRTVDHPTTASAGQGIAAGQATWQLNSQADHVWCRLSVRDRAGNGREAGAEATRSSEPPQEFAAAGQRRMANNTMIRPETTPQEPAGWTAGGQAMADGRSPAQGTWPGPSRGGSVEVWPSDGESLVPLGTPGRQPTDDASPQLANGSPLSDPRQAQRPAWSSGNPFANASVPTRLPPLPNASASTPGAGDAWTPPGRTRESAPGRSQVQLLNSLEFEVGFDVDTAGTMGVTRVELWGTRDHGQTWQRLAVDTDNRSPILASVPEPGEYGLKIVVETAGGIDPVRPRPGDRPEMYVRVDLTPPTAQLTGVEQGEGHYADHLMISWATGTQPTDGDSVAIRYSTQPGGPWTTAATNLPNNGRYAWRLARHVPSRFYVRLEIRDAAGNVATDQTDVPVEVHLPTPSGRLQSARPLGR